MRIIPTKLSDTHYVGALTVSAEDGSISGKLYKWGFEDSAAKVSGLTYEIHTYIESTVTMDEHKMFTGVEGDRRVQNVKVDGKPIDLKKVYTVASHDYMLLNNGDGVTAFDGCKVLQQSVKLDNQVLIDYITGTLGGKIGEAYSDPYGEGRIVIVNEAP